jgi:hypothetical protein
MDSLGDVSGDRSDRQCSPCTGRVLAHVKVPSFEKWELEFGLSAVRPSKRIRAGRPRPQSKGADRLVAGDRTGRRRCSAAGYGLGRRRILSQKPSVSFDRRPRPRACCASSSGNHLGGI